MTRAEIRKAELDRKGEMAKNSDERRKAAKKRMATHTEVTRVLTKVEIIEIQPLRPFTGVTTSRCLKSLFSK